MEAAVEPTGTYSRRLSEEMTGNVRPIRRLRSKVSAIRTKRPVAPVFPMHCGDSRIESGRCRSGSLADDRERPRETLKRRVEQAPLVDSGPQQRTLAITEVTPVIAHHLATPGPSGGARQGITPYFGHVKREVLPLPFSDSSVTKPFFSSTIFFTKAKPMPLSLPMSLGVRV